MKPMSPISAEALLEHRAWLRQLAQRLASDSLAAEDLLQDTWVRALQRPPAPGPRSSVRAWLGSVLRNQARRRWQRAQLRERQEQLKAGERPEHSTDDLFAIQRGLMEAVDRLPRQQREAILLRYFEDLPPRKIAERLGLPVKTINSRITRALSQLRGRLKAEHQDDEQPWLLGLLPLLDSRSSLLTFTTGSLIMGLKIFIAAILTGGACLIGWQALRPQTSQASRSSAALPTLLEPELTRGLEPELEAKEPLQVRESLTPEAPLVPGESVRIVEAQVIDSDGGHMSGFPVQFVPRAGEGSREALSLRADAEGHLDFEWQSAGQLESQDEDYVDLIIPRIHERLQGTAILVVARNLPLQGICVDPSGEPIDGVSMRALLPAELHARTGVIFDGHTSLQDFYGRSQADGRFQFSALPAVLGTQLEFSHAAFEPHSLEISLDPSLLLRVVLEPKSVGSLLLGGVLLDPDGATVAGAKVALGDAVTETDELGQFEFRLSEVEQPSRLMALYPGFAPVVQKALPNAAGYEWPEFVELQFTGVPKEIQGRVLDAEGQPVPGARVWIVEPTHMGYDGDFPIHVERALLEQSLLWVNMECDAQGRFRHGGLMDKTYAMQAGNPASGEFSEVLQATPGSEATLRFAPQGTTSIEGTVLDRSGQPVEGARVFVDRVGNSMADKKGDHYLSQMHGPRTVTDALGHFQLDSVARKGCTLHVADQKLIELQLDLDLALDPEPLQLRVDARCQLRIEVQSLELLADGVMFLDAQGKRLQVRRSVRDAVHITVRAPLPEGVQTLEVSQAAQTAVFFSGDEEVLRLPIQLSAKDVNYLRP